MYVDASGKNVTVKRPWNCYLEGEEALQEISVLLTANDHFWKYNGMLMHRDLGARWETPSYLYQWIDFLLSALHWKGPLIIPIEVWYKSTHQSQLKATEFKYILVVPPILGRKFPSISHSIGSILLCNYVIGTTVIHWLMIHHHPMIHFCNINNFLKK